MEKSFYEQMGVAMTCRDFQEYLDMFDLSEAELCKGAILDVAAGGSSFTAQAREQGYEAFAVDPKYAGAADGWVKEARGEIVASTAKLEAMKEQFEWSYYGSLDNHRKGRELSLNRFSSHAGTPDGAQFYLNGALPRLPFEDNTFSLVLCSHFLFLYAEQFGYDFHVEAVRELMRISKPGGEIRLYPLLSLRWEPYDQLKALMDMVRMEGGIPQLKASKLTFIPGSDQMLQIAMAT